MQQRRIREWLQRVWRKAQPFLVAQLPHTDEEAAILFTFAVCLFAYFSSPAKPSLPPDNPPAREQTISTPVVVPALASTQPQPASEEEDTETFGEDENDEEPLLLPPSFSDKAEEDDISADAAEDDLSIDAEDESHFSPDRPFIDDAPLKEEHW